MFVVDLDRGVPVSRVVLRKSVFGDDATRAASARVEFVDCLALCAVLVGSATVLTAPAVRTRGAEHL